MVFPPEERGVSRRHASLREEDGVLVLRDLGSTTGTFLDGINVEEAELGTGDVIELGSGGPRLRLEVEEEGTVVGMAPPVLPAAERPREPAPASAIDSAGLRVRLRFTSGSRQGDVLELAGSVFRIGRGLGCAVFTPDDRLVSSQHAKVVRLERGYVLIDLDSKNGTYLNGQRVERTPLQHGDIIGLGPGGPTLVAEVLAPEGGDLYGRTISIPNFGDLVGRRQAQLPVAVRDVTLLNPRHDIGRDITGDIVLDSPIVSRRHARLERREGALVVTDLGSSNGTYLRGLKIGEETPLAHGDRVVVGPFELCVAWPDVSAPPVLQIFDTRRRTRIDVRNVSVRSGSRSIVENVSLSVRPGCLVALIGPSGAGKSTLLSAMSGARPATSGEVLLNGRDLYESFESLKATIGYVPQDDIVHQQLTVVESLEYTARLRLPADTTRAERERRIAEVLATLELTERRDTPIHRLSGGQRKRVSIATELLTEPNVLFLDEPTSGLDPGLEEALMLLLRELSYKGKTVVLVTHTLDNISLCDSVALLADGRLAFYGPPAAAREHFGIEHMVNLYTRLKELTPVQWEARFQASRVNAQLVTGPIAVVPPPSPLPAPRPGVRERTPPGPVRQLGILAGRYATTLFRDGRNALLLLAQAPLIAALIGLSLLYGASDVAYTKPKNTILFLLALTSVWFGCSNAARELVKERAIYLREHMVNLRVLPYVASKVLVLGAMATVQCLAFLLILDGWFMVPGSFVLLLGAMVLSSLVGILLGLALSALAGSADRAMTLLPILLIPQVLFTSPAVQMDMKGPAGFVARAMPTWWAFDLLRRVALEPDEESSDDAVEARLQRGELVLMTKTRFTSMLQEGYPVFEYRNAIETTWVAELPERLGEKLPARVGRWAPALVDAGVLGGMGLALLAATVMLQRRHDEH